MKIHQNILAVVVCKLSQTFHSWVIECVGKQTHSKTEKSIILTYLFLISSATKNKLEQKIPSLIINNITYKSQLLDRFQYILLNL